VRDGVVGHTPPGGSSRWSTMAGVEEEEEKAKPTWRDRVRGARDSALTECCDCGDCCDIGIFSSLLMLGSVTAAKTRAPVLDRAGVAMIRAYRRWLSPHWPGTCRFTPTCGAYGLTAVERYGLAVGGRTGASVSARRAARYARPGALKAGRGRRWDFRPDVLPTSVRTTSPPVRSCVRCVCRFWRSSPTTSDNSADVGYESSAGSRIREP
jgi:putative component of membrane protein insertase Oxa1/YidC/SpoIIIJ protein YidD